MTFTYERRLVTFSQFKWPHGKETKFKSQPEEFAQAGFYCRPTSGSIDTVSCFLCLKSLDGWEPTDSAWQEHKNHSPLCPLVTLYLLASRLRTFDKWTGEKLKGGVSGLAEAGFFYFPKMDGDDTCICYQCGLALDGWERDDDPHHEHSRRNPNCPHVVNKAYIQPASFEFILAGKSDQDAVKDITTRRSEDWTGIPLATPVRRNKPVSSSSLSSSTAKSTSKKIRISVDMPSTNTDNTPLRLSSSTPISSKSRIIVTSSANKKQPSTSNSNSTLTLSKLNKNSFSLQNDLFTAFPQLKKESGILNWTVEDLLNRLISEKVEMFKEFLQTNEK